MYSIFGQNFEGEMTLKKNTKFIWIYVAILFSFALILILFAGLTQNNYQKEITDQQLETAGVRKSLSALTKENEAMKKQIDELGIQIETLKNDNATILAEKEAALVAYGGDVAVTRTLLQAYSEKLGGHPEVAAETVKGLDVYSMTQAQRYVYNLIFQ